MEERGYVQVFDTGNQVWKYKLMPPRKDIV